jgi:non-specific serine/threonine protein kinase
MRASTQKASARALSHSAMNETVCLTPGGRLVVETVETDVSLEQAQVERLSAAFGRSSAHGLLWLLLSAQELRLPPELVYWREFAQRYIDAACRLALPAIESSLVESAATGARKDAESHASIDGDVLQSWRRLDPPTAAELSDLVEAAPPMRGLEYLSAEVLVHLWGEVHSLAIDEASNHRDGAGGFLRDLHPSWRLLGRVTFHLAENKRDSERPFAFLATYARRVAANARVQHVPLGEALKEFAGTRNQSRLIALLEPARRAASESPVVRQLLDTRGLFGAQAWSVRQAHQFLLDVPRIEAAGVVVRVPDWWNAKQPPRPQVRVSIGQQPAGQLNMDSLLDFTAELALDGEPLTDREREELLQGSEGLVLLRGRWVEVDRKRLQEALDHWQQLQSLHPDGLSFIQGMRLLAGAPVDLEAESDTTADWSQAVAGTWLRETLQALRQPRGIAAFEPGANLRATLRPYQGDGVRWLWFLTRLGLGACLADDMGLGKTIQVIDLLLQLKREGSGPGSSPGFAPIKRKCSRASLLVVPASLVGNWKQEFERFAPSLRVFYAHRTESSLEQLSELAADPNTFLTAFDVVVTTYGLARQNEWPRAVSWQLVVLDEAQAIKNASSTQARSVKKLEAASRIVLTGTPIENHLGDLWSIFDFCCPGLLGSSADFKRYIKRLNREQDSAAYAGLRRLVQPYILRRLKTDPNVAPDLPEKTEMRVECGLSKKQAVLYERAVADFSERLRQAEGIARRGLVLAVLMQMKQICNHPDQYLNRHEFKPAESGKFERLQSICEAMVERQEKVLVFTQFQSLCDPLAVYLKGVFGRGGLVLSGKTPVRKRTELVRQFQEDGGPPFLVVSVKAGGSGLNLTAASHVVHFDRWWNPAVENQATDRAFRIGQKKNILVHKFVCRGTVEERIDQMIRDKQGLAEKLLSPEGEVQLTEMSDDELLAFVALDLNRADAET